MTRTRRAVIVGAGIAGLAAALRLHQIGWEPIVVERAPARRSGGYAVTFSGIGYDAAERMGILPALAERHITPDEMTYIRPDGTTRFSVPGPTVRAMLGDRALNLLRGDIEDVLHSALRDQVQIRYGTTVTAVAQDDAAVHVTLSDGTAVDADLLVGADGLHSATRALVFGPEQDHRLDLDHMVGVYLMDRRPDAVPEGTTATLTVTGRTLAIISLGPDRAAAFFGYRTDDPARDLAEGPQKALPRVYEGMGWAAPHALAQLRTTGSVYFDTISQIVMNRWSHGRVVLLGDAAWCVTLFAGYGSSLAVGGAELLGSALQRHPDDAPAALAAWEAQLRPEAERKQKLGRRVKGLYAPADPLRLWLRDLPLRMAALPPMGRLLQRRLQLKG
ncbi:FAD-dependent monooxygenase [Pseudonocardia kunmingensis]|uniref:2-polyprenyl-6-methoxyphenol hydroxylase-like FAD-dependent oxidoreductase n=1 Tax=Pseudonocardia kunmingensis TaxID=630975 RepID=A0A543DX40_9PSEU|nr:FAD-dependent monooxygenase [Pseudonocardia kunmingensis]TQM13876.1 2-polyprenyl-6-methoxyphenol hydroxylase-like FAD-dependent oxidoreductase [Pseudonocardia kunmingensis]